MPLHPILNWSNAGNITKTYFLSIIFPSQYRSYKW